MIERIYIDNIRSFVNFEFRPGPMVLLAGANGSGKTALIEVIRSVQSMLMGVASCDEAFPEELRTRWGIRTDQTVELDVRGPTGVYCYRLAIAADEEEVGRTCVQSETLQHEGKVLFQFTSGQVFMPVQGEEPGSLFLASKSRSAIGMVEPTKKNTLLAWFKRWVWGVSLLRPDPRAMLARYERPSPILTPNQSNFCAWYTNALMLKPGAIFKANATLSAVLPGFIELFEVAGRMSARFEHGGSTVEFAFDELSDGQRALIALYVVRQVSAAAGRVLVIDEPDNYVALREIQPWLNDILDATLISGGPQVWLISHHPELLNMLAGDYGWRMFRDDSGPSRIERFATAEGLDAAETAARGWEDAR